MTANLQNTLVNEIVNDVRCQHLRLFLNSSDTHVFYIGFSKIFSNWCEWLFCQFSGLFFRKPIILNYIALFVLRFLCGFISSQTSISLCKLIHELRFYDLYFFIY